MLAGFDEDITSAVPNGVEVEVSLQMSQLTVMSYQMDGPISKNE
jgi:hypothetical protein